MLDLPGSTTAGSKCRYLSRGEAVAQEPGVPIGEAEALLRGVVKKQWLIFYVCLWCI